MTPETLAHINDLRQRIVLADEALRRGDEAAHARLMPSDADIIAALEAARTQRSSATTAKAEKAVAKARTASLTSADIAAMFE